MTVGAVGLNRSLAGKVLGRQKTLPEEEKIRVQAEMATAQAAAEEARFDLARTLSAVSPPCRIVPATSVCLT